MYTEIKMSAVTWSETWFENVNHFDVIIKNFSSFFSNKTKNIIKLTVEQKTAAVLDQIHSKKKKSQQANSKQIYKSNNGVWSELQHSARVFKLCEGRKKGDEGERGGTRFNEQKANRQEGEVMHGVAQKKWNST